MIINHNLGAMNAQRQMSTNQNNMGDSMEKLSSGLRINRAGDDAAGLAISEKMRGQIRGLEQADRNAQDGISMIQTAEGALNETHSILQRMRELAVQASNDSNVGVDRQEIQKEMDQMTSEINRIGNTTEFNTQKVLNGGVETGEGAKITQATSATIAGTAVQTGTTADTLTVTVDNRTFDIGGIAVGSSDAAGAEAAAKELGERTSGGVKLSELVDIKNDGSNITFTAKSSGENSSIKFSATDSAIGTESGGLTATGSSATMERAGVEAATAFSVTTVAAGDSFSLQIGDGESVDVAFSEAKTYAADDAGRKEFAQDLNSALKTAGFSGEVTAAISNDNKVQLISESGKDLSLSNVASNLSSTGLTDSLAPKNVEQAIGPGAQGAGFTASFQVGANTGQSINLNINDMRSAALGITGNAGEKGYTSENGVTNGTNDLKAEAGLDVSSHESASEAITKLNDAIESVSSERSNLGSIQNRLEHTINNLGTSAENLQAAESRVRDVDMAKEMMEMTKNNILSQASQSMLAQANQQPQSVLQLLG